MLNREEVVKGLEDCSSREAWKCAMCKWYYEDGGECFTILAADALALLREQEPVKPINHADMLLCGNCRYAIPRTVNFCPKCGRAVKWDA